MEQNGISWRDKIRNLTSTPSSAVESAVAEEQQPECPKQEPEHEEPDQRISALERRLAIAEEVLAIVVERFPNPLPTESRKIVNDYLQGRS